MTTTIRIDDDLKTASEAVLDDLGLSMSGAVTLFLTQVVKQKAIPFEIRCDRAPHRYKVTGERTGGDGITERTA